MNDIPADILIYALVAAGLIFWLRNILGTRHGDEPTRPNQFVSPPENQGPQTPQPHASGPEAAYMGFDGEAIYNPFEDEDIILNQDISETLKKINQRLPDFEPAGFLKNAEEAFVTIVEAFSEGDRELLQELLNEDVYHGFDKEITAREARGEVVATEIQAIKSARIIDAALHQREAFVTIEFHAEETCVISDRDGNHIAGNAHRTTEMVDIWTFGRSLKARSPVWYVYETRDGDPEEHKTPIPDAGHQPDDH